MVLLLFRDIVVLEARLKPESATLADKPRFLGHHKNHASLMDEDLTMDNVIVGGTIDGPLSFAAQVMDKLINFAFIHTKSVKDRWEIADIVNCIFRTSGERECAAFDSSS